MPFHEELLIFAVDLARLEKPNQAILRRAVSTAYYALFHLLIGDAVSRWAIERQRNDLARAFDHGKMKTVCESLLSEAKKGSVPADLTSVADRFVVLQQKRHSADYNNNVVWTRAEAEEVVGLAVFSFTAWNTVRAEPAAEDFLLRMLVPKLRH